MSDDKKGWYIGVIRTVSDEFPDGVFSRAEAVVCKDDLMRFVVFGKDREDAEKGANVIIKSLTTHTAEKEAGNAG